ncbi:MAG: hypothetical protein J1F16_05770 [Muribaculaceae bacterium]|nr:hypothetical protein [Muribaculaceae bacterium]
MSKVSISRLADDVKTVVGDSLLDICLPEDSPFPDMENRVRVLAPGLLADILITAPFYDVGGVKNFSGPIETDKTGCVTMPLPDDFLKLVSIKMSDWQRAVSEITDSQSPKALQQGSRFPGIRGTPQRPVVILEGDAGGKLVVKMYSSTKGATLESACYISRPEVDSSDMIEVPPGVYHQLVMALVHNVQPSFTSASMR